MNKIVILKPRGLKLGQPCYERLSCFEQFYREQGLEVESYPFPIKFLEKVKFIFWYLKNKSPEVFLSMPPFRSWMIFFIPFIKITLDVRDGWSIAIRTGYGGIKEVNRLKASVARLVELFAIFRSYRVITCTPGLHKYLSRYHKNQILLIPNGSSDKDLEILSGFEKHEKIFCPNEIIVVCAGKFSEYGRSHVRNVLKKLSVYADQKNKNIYLKIIGCNYIENEWLFDVEMHRIKIDLVKRLERNDLFFEIKNADMGINIVRNPNYDLGTKVFDYIACGVPIFNYFERENNYTIFFKDYFHNSSTFSNEKFLRRNHIMNYKDELTK